MNTCKICFVFFWNGCFDKWYIENVKFFGQPCTFKQKIYKCRVGNVSHNLSCNINAGRIAGKLGRITR